MQQQTGHLEAYRSAFSRAVVRAISEVGVDNLRRCSWFGHSGDIHRQARGEAVEAYRPLRGRAD